jgi:TonB family protein
LSAITANDKTKGKDLSDNIHTGGKAVAPVSSPATASDIPANQDAVLKSTQVTRKFVVVTMPIPEYTEEARRHQTAGKVRVRTVFSSSGKVINITPIDTLPFGLTEKAVEAVQRLKFIPSVKDGKYVSTYTMLELTFNIY